MFFNRTLCVVLLFFVMSQLKAEPIDQEQQQKASAFVQSIYHNQAENKALSMPERLEKMSHLFLGRPYLLGALGEGMTGRYDQYPLYRMDAFDCQTFVETVLALSLAHDVAAFKHIMNVIRYQDGQVSFLKRHHFTDLDWNATNQHNGFLKDVTLSIHNQDQQAVAKIATAVINKPAWYQHIPITRIRLDKLSTDERAKRLSELKEYGRLLPIQTATIPYLPLTVLLSPSGKVNEAILNQIPNGAIIEIVRPGWDLREAIGTQLNVSHLGFGFWKEGRLIFRNASTLKGRVVDQPLVEYLQDALHSPTIKGINIQVVDQPK